MRRAVLPLMIACNTTSGPVAQHVAIAPVATTATASAPVVRDVCKRARDERRVAIDGEIASAKKENPADWPAKVERDVREAFFDETVGMGLACHAFARGAWAVEAQSFTLYPQWNSASGELVPVAYVDGARVASEEPMRAGYGAMFTRVTSQLASDYDGDGVPELWMHSDEDGVEGGHSEESRLYTFDRGAVRPYGPAKQLEDLGIPRDVDGDGLLDFTTSYGIHLGDGVVCEGRSDWSSAKFLAHAKKDGTFSTDDDAAKAHVKSWCASAPTSVKKPEEALCAKLWKAPRSLVTSSCVVWDCNLEVANKPQPKRATRDCEDRIAAYDATVPFTLP